MDKSKSQNKNLFPFANGFSARSLKQYVALLPVLCIFLAGLSSCDDDDIVAETPLPMEIDGKYVVEFNLNYDGAPAPDTLLVVPGRMMPVTEKRMPVREGYRFGGWYTSKECRPEQEWIFGAKNGGGYPSVVLDSMAVKSSMRLYAYWVAPTHIKTAEQLGKIRENLYGWYILDNDIDLSGVADWMPIGEYESDCEMADGEWWKKAFKGRVDGQGHKVTNLNLKSDNPSMKALFGALANGEVCNLTLENCRIDLSSPSAYVAPLIGVMKQDGGRTAMVQNCEVRNVQMTVNLNMSQGIFSSVSGLVAGAWNGTIDRCKVSGDLKVALKGNGDSGELYVGGILGEGYSDTRCCSSELNLQADVQVEAKLKVFIGGLQASATNVENSISKGNIAVSGSSGIAELYVGGLIGSERYGFVKCCAAQGNITVTDAPVVQIGGVIGEFSKTYGMIGTAFGIAQTSLENCYASGVVRSGNTSNFSYGYISGSGQPEPLAGWFGSGMSYLVGNCCYLKQGYQNAADAALPYLKGFDTVDAMKGESMEEWIGRGAGSGQWQFESNSLPIPGWK